VWQLQAVPMSMQGTAVPVHTWIECHEVNGSLYQAALRSMEAGK
jgi:hypothetical protein